MLANRRVAGGDVLAVATMGRSAWTLDGAEVALAQAPVLSFTGTTAAEAIVVSRRASNPGIVDFSVNGAVIYSTPYLTVSKIVVVGGGGNDTLTVDSTNGPLAFAGGISFTGGANDDTLILTGGKANAVTVPTTGTKRTYTVEDTVGTTASIVFEDFGVAGTDTFTNNLTTPGNGERIVDGLSRLKVTMPAPELAVLGKTLTRVLDTGGRTEAIPPSAISDRQAEDPDAIGTGEAESEAEGEGGAGPTGIAALFTLPSGETLWELVAKGEISDTGSLMDALTELVGEDGSVVNNGTSEAPLITLVLNKKIEGSADIDVAFDKLGGHAAFTGSVEVSAVVHLNLTFGVDPTLGFFIRTDGAGPEVSIDTLELDGDLHAEGQLGFLGVELENASVEVNGVSISLDLNAPSGSTIYLSDLDDIATIASLATVAVNGDPNDDDVVIEADLAAMATMPGGGSRSTSAAATPPAWADISQPLRAGRRHRRRGRLPQDRPGEAARGAADGQGGHRPAGRIGAGSAAERPEQRDPGRRDDRRRDRLGLAGRRLGLRQLRHDPGARRPPLVHARTRSSRASASTSRAASSRSTSSSTRTRSRTRRSASPASRSRLPTCTSSSASTSRS